MKYFPFKLKHGKKILIFFVAINIVILWFFYYKSTDISYYYQSKPPTIKPAPAPIYNVSLFHIPLLNAKDMTPFYSEVKSKTWCFLYGIDLIESKKREKCVCLDNWFGLDCGIPAAVWKSSFLQEGKNANIEIRRREKPRRIVSSFVVDNHQDVLDINVFNSFSIVDLFLTVEGSARQPSILSMFKSGHLAQWQSKIIPFQLKRNVTSQMEEKQIVLMLKELWDIGWKRLTDFRPDDILLFSHVSSIISKDVLLFLKLYDGFSEPFSFQLRPLLFKFWREMITNNTDLQLVPFRPLGCTFQFIASMCNFEVSKFFTNTCDAQDKKSFEKNNWQLKSWSVGGNSAPSGWQCNLCCKDKCLGTNQTIANEFSIISNNTDVSRLKHYLEKRNIFNSKDLFFKRIPDSDSFFAPAVVLNNPNKYSYLIDLTEQF